MEMTTLVLADDNGIRPAGKPDECFYCRQKIGTPHKDDCVCLEKLIKVRYTFEFPILEPAHWDEKHYHFCRNEGTCCASNAIAELIAYRDSCKEGCLCHAFEAEYLEDVDPTPRSSNYESKRPPRKSYEDLEQEIAGLKAKLATYEEPL